jgi:hypothetical protein
MTRVLVCGSRDWDDQFAIWCVLNGYAADGFGVTVINGGALGADRIARKWATLNGHPCETYKANWTVHGKAAGPLRNALMLADGKPDIAWCFVTKPLEKSRGSFDMVKRLKAAGIPTYVVTRS